MKKLIAGVLLFFVGVGLGLYVGVWWAFIGGILLLIEGAQADPVNASWVAYGVARVFFAGALGYISAIVCILPSFVLMAAGLDDL